MPKKPVRWGIKIWCLCDSLKGYCLTFNVYTGKEGCVADALGLGYRVDRFNVRLPIILPHHLYADNFCPSIPLVRNLLCPTEASLRSSGLSLFLSPMSSLLSDRQSVVSGK